jgi:hypothetical protein
MPELGETCVTEQVLPQLCGGLSEGRSGQSRGVPEVGPRGLHFRPKAGKAQAIVLILPPLRVLPC